MLSKYDYQYMYFQKLKKVLVSKGYTADKYVEKNDIDNIIVDSLKFICNEFEQWAVKNLTNFDDILNVIGYYSKFKSDIDAKRIVLNEEISDFFHT